MTTTDPLSSGAAADARDPLGPCLIMLIGIAGVGKSTWAAARYPHEHLCSADAMREALCDDAGEQGVTSRAWRLLEQLVEERCALGKRAIIDGTHVKAEDRMQWVKLARERGWETLAVWFDLEVEQSLERQVSRERKVGQGALSYQREALGEEVAARLVEEGWQGIWRVGAAHAPGEFEVVRAYEPPRYRELPAGGARIEGYAGYDVVGDVHGCLPELEALLEKLGWRADAQGEWRHAEQDRALVFVGDLADRGPDSVGVVALVARLWRAGRAFLVRGNHDDKLRRYLQGNNIKIDAHLRTTADEFEALTHDARERWREASLELLERSPYWALLDRSEAPHGGCFAPVVVAHAAWKPSLMYAKEDKVRWFCLYGPSTGRTDERGYPERLDWRERYPSDGPRCVTGHTAYGGESVWHGRTLCVDTGCVFGARLTAWRWPEQELVSAPFAGELAHEPERLEEQPVLHPYSARKR